MFFAMNRVRLFLVDDHKAVLDGLYAALSMYPHLNLIGKASSYDEAISTITHPSFAADVIITDYTLDSERDGVELCREAKRLRPEQRVVLLTMHQSNALHFRAQRAGVDHYLEKTTPVELIVKQLNALISGDILELSRYDSEISAAAPITDTAHELSAREIEVLHLIACEELTTKQIAERLCRSVQTIETHRAHLFQKLDVASVVGLVKYAMSNGLCTGNGAHYSGNA